MAIGKEARALALVPLAAWSAITLAPQASAAEITFALEGAQMVARDARDATVADEDVVGATIRFGDAGTGIYTVRIDAVIADPPPGPTRLYDLSVQVPGNPAWQKLCEADPQGRTTAIPVPGSWHGDAFVRGAMAFACTAGARGKCLRLGYLPWAITPAGESMAPYHAACTRMMRADYCGDGTPHTVPGVQVQVFDSAGIVLRASPGFGSFEAAWGQRGAVCVGHARVPAYPLAQIRESCPRLAAAKPCSEDAVGTLPGALLGNRS